MNTTPDPLLTPAEAASYFNVSPKTIGRWANQGRIPVVLTLGGHRRYRQSDIIIAATRTRPARDVPTK